MRSLLIPADIRFPLERANGVQILKTAEALAQGGLSTTLAVRNSDPRSTAEILSLFGITPNPKLVVRRLKVRHRPGSFLVPRVGFLAQAGLLSLRHLGQGGVVFSRDLQLVDLLLRVRGRRVVYEAHAVESLMYQERGTLYGTAETPRPGKAERIARREGRVWRRAAAFVATTAGIRDSLTERHGVRERCRVIPNGCEMPVERSFPGLSAERPPRVLYAGQLYPWKGVDVLVEAMAQLPEARLAILGGLKGEADLARIQALVARRGLASRVEFLGTVPQVRVAEELARAAVVAVPFLKTAMSERHTSPLKAFEAMAAGRPLVASDLPASREILQDGENALLVSAGEAPALAAAIRRLIEEPVLAERLARAAWEQAPRYAWPARARALAGLFEELP